MSKQLIFHCPSCKYERQIEQVRTNAIISVPIERIEQIDGTEFEVQFDYGHEQEYESVIDRFQCVGCAFYIKDDSGNNIQDEGELVEWLKKRPENKGVSR